uniref:Uncharacterized protein n=1 Tax=Anguilla anguilla TaxID=7936 RepID=A0A0E9XP50_ANGAN
MLLSDRFLGLLHGAWAGVLELQLHGCPARSKHEVRLAAVQPEGVLPRGPPTLALPQLRIPAGGRDLQRRPRGHVRLERVPSAFRHTETAGPDPDCPAGTFTSIMQRSLS